MRNEQRDGTVEQKLFSKKEAMNNFRLVKFENLYEMKTSKKCNLQNGFK